MELKTLLLVDDDQTFRMLLERELRRLGYEVITAGTVAEARAQLASTEVELGVFDLRLPDGDGTELLSAARERYPEAEVVMLTGHGSIDSAIQAMRLGAFDYLRKPCAIEELEVTLGRAVERQRLVQRNLVLSDGLAPPDMRDHFVGVSPPIEEIRQLVDSVAPTDATVLLLGETGVGKEVVARMIHARSERRDDPFVVVECACLHHELLHSELFGHVRGAFTGAHRAKHGLFEVADRGTLFLDEIGDVSPETQTKLLRALETGSFRRAGAVKEVNVDVRLVAATNRNLEELMKAGHFRSDLYYRLSTIRVVIPPLRERLEDIPVLTEAFLERMNARMKRNKRFDDEALACLSGYRWPGNVRELLHAVERAVILSPGEVIGVPHLPPEIRQSAPADDGGELLTLAELEQRHIDKVLRIVQGNRAKAASILGISERTLYRKLAQE